MKKISKTFWKMILDHKIWSSIVSILLVIFITYIFFGGKEKEQNFVLVEKGNIKEEVSVTGKVKPVSEVDLSFERGGKVANINISVGDTVFVGQTLASISNADLLANLAQAEANLKKALAQYNEVKLGTRVEEITLQETQLIKAEQDLAQAKTSLVNTIKDSYTKADDAVRNKIFSLFTDPVKYRARLAFTTNSFLREDIEEGKDEAVEKLDSWYRSLERDDLNSNIETYYNVAKNNLTFIKTLLDQSAEAVNGLNEDSLTTQTQIDTWKANISTARTNIDTAISILNSSFNSFNTYSTALQISKDQLAIKKAGSTSGAILSAEANYEIALAGVNSAEAELAKTIIRSPIAGVITQIPIQLGEIVPMNQKAITVISLGDYEIEAFVPEADFAKVKVGDKAITTFDAYGSDTFFETKVSQIDPAATIIAEVPTYKVTLQFISSDERIRAGMTVNLDILTNQKNDILILPNRVINTKDDGKYVSVFDLANKNEILEQKIFTGLRGSDGNIEIISGLNEGDKVLAD